MSLNLNFNSSTLALTGEAQNRSDDFIVNYDPAIQLEDNPNIFYECALYTASIPYVWSNINAKFGNNIFRYYTPRLSDWVQLTIDEGLYDNVSLTDFIGRSMIAQGDFYQSNAENPKEYIFRIFVNNASMKFYIQFNEAIEGQDWRIDFTAETGGKLNELLGFEHQTLTGSKEGENQADINRGIDQVFIHCDLISSSFVNSTQSNVLFAVLPNVRAGYNIMVQPFQPLFLKVNKRFIRDVHIWLTDQNNRPISLNNQTFSCSLQIVPRYKISS